MQNHNDRIFAALQARTNADRWLKKKAKGLNWLNPLVLVWLAWWFVKVRHTHYVVNYWRMVGMMEAYQVMVYRLTKNQIEE